MRIDFLAFGLQKAGNSADEYEDAFAPLSAPEGRCDEFRCAVADGATETSFSGLWARILAEAFVHNRLQNVNDRTITALSARWHQEIARRTDHKPLPWYAQEKLQQGAFSSLIGLAIRADGTWRARCVGDSCLFHIRPRQAIRAFPYYTPEQFNNRPALISTNADLNTSVRTLVARGTWQAGDYFLLMTDALAHFFLSQRQSRSLLVAGASNQARFETLVARARSERLCRNDDVTFLKIYPKLGDAPGVLAQSE